MMLSINTNMAALTAQRNLGSATNKLTDTYQRLSSGLRVNSAKDDSAGLSIATRMESQVRGMNQAQRNANDAISLLQTAESALTEIANNLQRVRELAVQASNDTYSDTDRDNIQAEIDELLDEVQRIGQSTSYNGRSLIAGLDPNDGATLGASATFHFQIGAYDSNDNASTAGETAGGNEDVLEVALQTVLITAPAAGTLVGANANATMADLAAFKSSDDSGTGGVLGTNATAVNIVGSGRQNAQDLISVVDDALNNATTGINTMRSNIGANINRLDAAISNLSTAKENVTDSRSRIMDADIAFETAELTRTSILQQASAAILAQANQQPALALQLLG
ncbi:MAG: flagellin FliC [Magnetococcus sp. WYHC-3]